MIAFLISYRRLYKWWTFLSSFQSLPGLLAAKGRFHFVTSFSFQKIQSGVSSLTAPAPPVCRLKKLSETFFLPMLAETFVGDQFRVSDSQNYLLRNQVLVPRSFHNEVFWSCHLVVHFMAFIFFLLCGYPWGGFFSCFLANTEQVETALLK